MSRKVKPQPAPAKVLPYPKPDGPASDHPFFKCWIAEFGQFYLSVNSAAPEFSIKPNDILYCEEIPPQPGDIVVAPTGTEGRVFVGRCVRFDGFRLLMDTASLRQLATPSHVLVVKHIAE